VVINTSADATRTAIGDEECQYNLGYTFTGGSGAGDFDLLSHKIENLHRTSNKSVTVSFWATGSTSSKVGVQLVQNFGSGGSASVAATTQTVTSTTAWARYSATFTVPSVAGKTFGTAGTDYLSLQIWLSSGSTNNAQAGSIGVQSGVVQFWGMQLEIGGAVTALEKPDPRFELANCQRFYQLVQYTQYGYGLAGASFGGNCQLPVTMRGTPAITQSTVTNTNLGTVTSSANTANIGQSVNITAAATATATTIMNIQFTASAEL
jgi:hypothetical protein